MTYLAGVRLGLPQVKLDEETGKPVLQYGNPIYTGDSTIKEEGATVTLTELRQHGQTEDQIAELLKNGSLVDPSKTREA